MKTIMMLFAAIVAAACTHGGRPETRVRAQTQAAEDEAKLAAALSGRIAGPAQDCVNERDLGGSESYGGRVILFRGPTDDVVYVNRPPTGCQFARADPDQLSRQPSGITSSKRV